MGVDTIIVTLSMVLTELKLNIQFSVMAAQISIHMVRGTFSQLVYIANHFLHGFYKLSAYIINRPLFFKSWIHHWSTTDINLLIYKICDHGDLDLIY